MSCKKVTRVRVKVQDISGGEIPDHNEVQGVGRYGGVGVEISTWRTSVVTLGSWIEIGPRDISGWRDILEPGIKEEKAKK